MDKIGYCVIIKTKPRKREEVMKLWEKYIKPHAIESKDVLESYYSFDINDPDVICLFEVLSSAKALGESINSKWLNDYKEKISPFMEEPPNVIVSELLWIKE